MDLNLKSVLLGSRFAIPHMQKVGGGSIINTASMAAFASDVQSVPHTELQKLALFT